MAVSIEAVDVLVAHVHDEVRAPLLGDRVVMSQAVDQTPRHGIVNLIVTLSQYVQGFGVDAKLGRNPAQLVMALRLGRRSSRLEKGDG